MINYTGWDIPEGKVVKVTDASGAVIWAVQEESGVPIVLEVEKITSDTYAGETTYTAEEFILLDIYPKSANSTVKVTYGGLTKTLVFTGTNSQKVHFGTFNGVSDEVEPPASGTLNIEGGCVAVACGSYSKTSKGIITYLPCITGVNDWGSMKQIAHYMFYLCKKLTEVNIPNTTTKIGTRAFADCIGLTSLIIPASVTEIGNMTFTGCTGLTDVAVLATTPPKVGTAVFGTNTTNTITVPSGCGEAYKTAEGWSEYADRIVEAS